MYLVKNESVTDVSVCRDVMNLKIKVKFIDKSTVKIHKNNTKL